MMNQMEIAAFPAVETSESSVRPVLTVKVEWLVYLTLVVLALVLRIAELDVIPLTESEAHHALSAWTLVHGAEQATSSTSPLLFALQAVSFNVLGGTELAARLLTALAGVGLVFTPLLFRALLGPTRTLLFCALLMFSPALLLASRFSHPFVWSMLLAILGLWGFWRYWQTERMAYALAGVALLGSMVFLTDPGAPMLAVILGGAGGITLALLQADNPDSLDTVAPDTLGEVRVRFEPLPWMHGLGLALLLIVVISTLFTLHIEGLSNIGTLLGATFASFTTLQPGMPVLHALLATFFYEPLLWGLGIAGLVLAIRGLISPLERFFVAWLILGIIGTLFFVGAQPAHALWLIFPLAGLGSLALESLLHPENNLIWPVPGWARWLLGLLMFGLMAMLSIALQMVARTVALTDSLETLQQNPVGVILVLMVIMLVIVGFFLAASVWNSTTALRGGALGLVIFGLITALSAGWNASVPRAGDAVEFWHLRTSTHDATLLRETLLEIAKRESRGFPEMPVTVAVADNSLIGWALRDFSDVRYVGGVVDARGDEIVLLPGGIDAEIEPDLGGSYVGQAFIVQRSWSPASLQLWDVLAWWLQRRAGFDVPLETVHLWLRQDIYEGVDVDAFTSPNDN